MTLGRVLIVDDERPMLQLLQQALEEKGYEVVTAKGAQEARAHFAETFHVAVFDKMLRDGDGIALGWEMRQVNPLCETILLTGFGNKEVAIEAVGAGFYAFWEKPVDTSRFTLTVRNAAAKAQLGYRVEQMRKMEALGRLASGVAHDFNNVLAVVGMTAEVLAMGDVTQEALREHAKEILEVVNMGRALAKQLVVFSRNSPPKNKRVVLNQTIADMSVLLGSIAGGRTVEIDTDKTLRAVQGDPDQLGQIVLNLVVNASDATSNGGRIKVKTQNCEGGITLSVEDNGCGMPPDVVAHIFEPYFTTKAEGKGTGLGLATVFAIVQKHQGHIGVQSQPGKGTRFDVFLPAAE